MGKAFWSRSTIPMNGTALQVVAAGTHVSHLEINNNSGSAVTYSGSAVGQEFVDVQIWSVPANSNHVVYQEPYHDVYFPNGLQVNGSAGNVVVVSGLSA